jgi:ABC-type phosphate/phosphonate transport system substrate-binding protein
MEHLKILATTAIAAVALTSAASANDWREEFPQFRYGVQSVETQSAAMSRYEKFGAYVQEKLGVELDLYLASEYAGVIQAIAAGQIEVMDMGASGYAAAWLETNGGVEPLVVPQAGHSQPSSRSRAGGGRSTRQVRSVATSGVSVFCIGFLECSEVDQSALITTV